MTFSPSQKREIVKISVGTLLYIAAILISHFADIPEIFGLVLFAPSYIILAAPTLIKAVKNISRGNMLDENFLMAVASLGAFALFDFSEGVAVMLFNRVGGFFEDYAVAKSRKDISELVNLSPDHANLLRDGELTEVFPDEVKVGETIVVLPGEKVPLDGKIISGATSFDTSGLTGESVPRDAKAGDAAISGYINLSGKIEVETEKEYADSTVSKILELIETATDKKSKSENFITRFARVYTPIVVSVALLIAVIPSLLHLIIPDIVTAGFGEYIRRALLFLVVSCPCALVVSVPLTFFGGIGGASKSGVLIKGSNYIEMLAKADLFVFDKTGTLTKGAFSVTEIISDNEKETLFSAAVAEQYSNHPIAKAIKKRVGVALPTAEVTEEAGKGVRAVYGEHTVLVGNSLLLEENDISFKKTDRIGTIVYVALDGKYLGSIVISDEIKEDSETAIKKINTFAETVILSGDSPEAARAVAQRLSVKRAIGGLLPQDKVAEFEKMKSGRVAVFTGDGINDAPVLAMADVGVAMGGLGQDAAIEAADIVIMDDSPSKLIKVRERAAKTMRIVYENITFSLFVKVGIMVLGALGLAGMWAAVFADTGVMILAVCNAVRASR